MLGTTMNGAPQIYSNECLSGFIIGWVFGSFLFRRAFERRWWMAGRARRAICLLWLLFSVFFSFFFRMEMHIGAYWFICKWANHAAGSHFFLRSFDSATARTNNNERDYLTKLVFAGAGWTERAKRNWNVKCEHLAFIKMNKNMKSRGWSRQIVIRLECVLWYVLGWDRAYRGEFIALWFNEFEFSFLFFFFFRSSIFSSIRPIFSSFHSNATNLEATLESVISLSSPFNISDTNRFVLLLCFDTCKYKSWNVSVPHPDIYFKSNC